MTTEAVSYTVRLKDLSRGDSELVGAKASNLGDLMNQGFPVPDGFAVTADAFDAFLNGGSIVSGDSPEKVASAPIPPDMTQALLAAVAELGVAPVAVRSSGVEEDLAGASYAGQYETILDVEGRTLWYRPSSSAGRQLSASEWHSTGAPSTRTAYPRWPFWSSE